jgi:hypothetical protein
LLNKFLLSNNTTLGKNAQEFLNGTERNFKLIFAEKVKKIKSMSAFELNVPVVFRRTDGITDSCERLISLLLYACFGRRICGMDDVSIFYERGSLYRGFISFGDLSLIEQVLYVFEKFSEFNDRLVAIATAILP